MKKGVSLLLAVILLVTQLPAVLAENKDNQNTILKNVALYSWDFSSEQQVSSDPAIKDVPVLAGGAEYDALNHNIKLGAAAAPAVSVKLANAVTAEAEENKISVEFDVNFGKIDTQYFSYSIEDEASNKVVDCKFMPYNKSTAAGYLKVAGEDVISDIVETDGSATSVNKQLANCISAVNSDGMGAAATHFKNEINLKTGTVNVVITSADKSGTFSGSFEPETYTGIAAFSASMTKKETSRYTYLDNLKITQYQSVTPPNPAELVHGITQKAEGDSTVVDTSKMVYGAPITSFLITTAKKGQLIKQYTTDIADMVRVDTAGAEALEIVPVYTYSGMEEEVFHTDSGVSLEPDVLGRFEDGRYDFSFQKANGTLTDIYVNGSMVVNNAEQTGKGRGTPKGSLCTVRDVKIEGGEITVKTRRDEYNGTTYPNAPIASITVQKVPSILERKTKITVLGDSLVCDYYGGRRETDLGSNQTGWGQQLSNFLDDSKVEILNLANSGHYAKILYETAMGGAVNHSLPGDIILCQVGYNDLKRSTREEMAEYMTKMARDAKEAGIRMVFVAPPATCDPEDWLEHTDGYVNTSYHYPVRFGDLVEETAAKLGAGFIDLSRFSYDYLTSLYGNDITAAGELYIKNLGVKDYIHLSYAGAMKWASFVAQSLFDMGYVKEVNREFNYTVTDTEGNQIVCALSSAPQPTTSPVATPTVQPTAAVTTAPTKEPSPSGGTEIYHEDFTEGDLSKWNGLTTAFSIKTDDSHGNYLSLAPGGNDRGIYTFFNPPAQRIEEYVYECDVRLKAGNTKSSQITLLAEDYSFLSGNENYGVENGYIMKLNTTASNTWTINPDTDNQTVTLPQTDWIHLKVSGTNSGTVLEITKEGTILYQGKITPSSNKTVPYGFYMRGGKSNAVMDIDNLTIKITLDDRFWDYSAFQDGEYIGVTILPEAEKLVYAALYNAENQLLSLKLVVCDGKARTVKFDRPEERGCHLQLYNWTDGMQPLSRPSDYIAVDQLAQKTSDTTDSFLYGSFTAEKSADGTMVYEHGMPYRYYLPQNYDSGKSYPVVMYLHGAGRRGTDNKEQLVNAQYMFNTLLSEPYINNPDTQCIMIAPQCPADEKWVDRAWADGSYNYESVPVSDELSMAHDILLEFMEKYNIDRDKVYIAGQSMGGYGCWRMAIEYPELFSAAIPLCGAGATDEKGAGRLAKENIAVWAFHGDADTTVPVSGSREMISSIRRLGAQKVNYTEMAGWGHDIQEEVFTGIGKTNGLYEWLFDQSRTKNAQRRALPDNVNETVDLALFAGQSNMSGRGEAAKAVMCDVNAGFEYKAISNPNTLVPVTEPFGLNEDKAGAIDDYDSNGKTKRSGSMVSAVVDEYYKQTGRQLVAVSASVGGTSTAQWKDSYIGDAVGRLDRAKEFLAENGIRVGRIFVVWCQGETDGDNNVSAQAYTENTKDLFRIMQEHGAQQCFMVQTGHYNYIDYPNGNNGVDGAAFDQRYGVIRTAQQELCAGEESFVLAGSLEPYIGSMKDQYHYRQNAYNEVGRTVGKTIAGFYK